MHSTRARSSLRPFRRRPREQKTRFLLLRLPKNQRNSTRPSRARVFKKAEERKSREKTPQKVRAPEKGRHAGSERERCFERQVTTTPRAPSSTSKSQKPRDVVPKIRHRPSCNKSVVRTNKSASNNTRKSFPQTKDKKKETYIQNPKPLNPKP